MECAISNLKNQKFATSYGSRLCSSSGRILLQSNPGLFYLFSIQFLFSYFIAVNTGLVYIYDYLLNVYIGMELYKERLVKALAHDLQVPLLTLDNSVLAPYVSVHAEVHPEQT